MVPVLKTQLPLRARNDHPRDYRCGATRVGQLNVLLELLKVLLGEYGRPPKVPSFWAPEAALSDPLYWKRLLLTPVCACWALAPIRTVTLLVLMMVATNKSVQS